MIVSFGVGVVRQIEFTNDGHTDVCELVLSVDNNAEILLPFKVWSSAAVHMLNNVKVGDTITFTASPRKENNQLFFKITEYTVHVSASN